VSLALESALDNTELQRGVLARWQVARFWIARPYIARLGFDQHQAGRGGIGAEGRQGPRYLPIDAQRTQGGLDFAGTSEELG